jgi:hypothetical protein
MSTNQRELLNQAAREFTNLLDELRSASPTSHEYDRFCKAKLLRPDIFEIFTESDSEDVDRVLARLDREKAARHQVNAA